MLASTYQNGVSILNASVSGIYIHTCWKNTTAVMVAVVLEVDVRYAMALLASVADPAIIN